MEKLLFLILMLIFLSCEKDKNINEGKQDQENIQALITSAETPVYYDWDKIKNRDTLKVATMFSPTSYFFYKGLPMGFDYELIKRFCSKYNLIMKIVVANNINGLFELLKHGGVDVLAYSMPVTKTNYKNIENLNAMDITREVLVQRNNRLLRSVISLIGKKVYVTKNTAYEQRLKNLSDEIGGDINIVSVKDTNVEALIDLVAHGKIKYTVADERIAKLNKRYYNNLNVSLAISFPQRISWRVRTTSPKLKKKLENWMRYIKRRGVYARLYEKYFIAHKGYRKRMDSKLVYTKNGKLKISKYDNKIKAWADSLNWDWLMLASLIYSESKFDPYVKSWAGATGLMQIMPQTAMKYGVYNIVNVDNNLKIGSMHIKNLIRQWSFIDKKEERLKFILASYNAGSGHVHDARRLARYYGKNPNVWENSVGNYIRLLSNEKYYKKKIVRYGYCRGSEPFNYVKKILRVYSIYKESIKMSKK